MDDVESVGVSIDAREFSHFHTVSLSVEAKAITNVDRRPSL
jgi:hypothetical protein